MRMLVAAIVLGLGCGTDSGATAAGESDGVSWFYCYPDQLGEAEGAYEKVAECSTSAAHCTQWSQQWHKENLCYRQEMAFCFVERTILGEIHPTCAGSLHGCKWMRGNRNAGECRARRVDAELRKALSD